MSIALYCGGRLDEGATLRACQALLEASGAGLRQLKLTVNAALAPHLHKWVGCAPSDWHARILGILFPTSQAVLPNAVQKAGSFNLQHGAPTWMHCCSCGMAAL